MATEENAPETETVDDAAVEADTPETADDDAGDDLDDGAEGEDA